MDVDRDESIGKLIELPLAKAVIQSSMLLVLDRDGTVGVAVWSDAVSNFCAEGV